MSNIFIIFAADMRNTIKRVFKYRVARSILNLIRALLIALISFILLVVVVLFM